MLILTTTEWCLNNMHTCTCLNYVFPQVGSTRLEVYRSDQGHCSVHSLAPINWQWPSGRYTPRFVIFIFSCQCGVSLTSVIFLFHFKQKSLSQFTGKKYLIDTNFFIDVQQCVINRVLFPYHCVTKSLKGYMIWPNTMVIGDVDRPMA